jgi:sulfite reductase (ferredoxin)
MADESPTLSEVEEIKRTSAHLRGDLLAQLADDSPRVSNDSEQLMKFHGIYAQDNRDVRRERAQAGKELDYIFMIRVAIPGGHLTPDQWLALDRVAEEIADGSIRLTTRQAVQFHGVVKNGLQTLTHSLHDHLMTSFGACGDVVRNIVTCPDLQTNDPNGKLAEMTEHLAKFFKPQTQAHWEIFVNGDKAASQEVEAEHSFYGQTYLPRKFKISIAHPDENCVDVFAQDCGLIPGTHPELGDGFTVVVGGGLGRSYANPNTFARLADPLTFATYDEIDAVITAVLETYRDLGDRKDRRHARMKYVVDELGIDGFRAEVIARYGKDLRPPLDVATVSSDNDHLGWTELHDGSLQLGIRVGAGRVKDFDGGSTLRSALRHIATDYPVAFYITAQQDILVANIPKEAREEITLLMKQHHVRLVEELGAVERNALACPALPTCGQALAESERRLPEMVNQIEDKLIAKGLSGRRLQLRMTGCPNGCARPGVAEVGIVGKTKSTYDLFLGGGLRGDRLATLYKEKVKFDEVPEILEPLFERWHNEGLADEEFGDFFERVVKT